MNCQIHHFCRTDGSCCQCGANRVITIVRPTYEEVAEAVREAERQLAEEIAAWERRNSPIVPRDIVFTI